MNGITKREDALFDNISKLIEEARKHVKTTVNTAMVYTYYGVGKYIVKDEQQGYQRATYGKQVLKELSKKLCRKYGEGWSYSNLRQIRQFYLTYGNLTDSVCQFQFKLSWSHYLILMRIENNDERNFYEIEATQQNWSVRELNRQVGSCLYERLALSRDKSEVMRLAKEGQTVEKPSDIIKNPITLEFLGLKPDSIYSESKLENAIISVANT